jgi:hypothetical protein
VPPRVSFGLKALFASYRHSTHIEDRGEVHPAQGSEELQGAMANCASDKWVEPLCWDQGHKKHGHFVLPGRCASEGSIIRPGELPYESVRNKASNPQCFALVVLAGPQVALI